MKKRISTLIATLFVITTLFAAGNLFAAEMKDTKQMSSDMQCTQTFDRDLSYSNPDYQKN